MALRSREEIWCSLRQNSDMWLEEEWYTVRPDTAVGEQGADVRSRLLPMCGESAVCGSRMAMLTWLSPRRVGARRP